MITEHVDVTMIGILVSLEVRVIFARPKLDVVPDEIALMEEIFLDNLFKYVLFRRQLLSPSDFKIQSARTHSGL